MEIDSFKCSLQCEAMGEIDELISLLGVIKELANEKNNYYIYHIMELIQGMLFSVNTELSTIEQKIKKDDVDAFQKICDFTKSSLNEVPIDFVIPGGCLLSAYLDLARTVTRRCERKIVKLYKDDEMDNKNLFDWINKLSYYLWLLARKVNENAK